MDCIGHLDLAAEGRVVALGKGLPVVFRPGHHHAVHQDAGDLDLPGVEGAPLGDPLHLHDHEAAGISGRHGDGQRFQGQRLLFHGDVAVGVRRGAPEDGHVDGKRLVGQIFPAVEL